MALFLKFILRLRVNSRESTVDVRFWPIADGQKHLRDLIADPRDRDIPQLALNC